MAQHYHRRGMEIITIPTDDDLRDLGRQITQDLILAQSRDDEERIDSLCRQKDELNHMRKQLAESVGA